MVNLVCLQETKVQQMVQVVRSLGVGRFLKWRIVEARAWQREFWSLRIIVCWNELIWKKGSSQSLVHLEVVRILPQCSQGCMCLSNVGRERIFGQSWVL